MIHKNKEKYSIDIKKSSTFIVKDTTDLVLQ